MNSKAQLKGQQLCFEKIIQWYQSYSPLLNSSRDFQFLWMTDVETVNSITMAFLATPVILVLNTQTHYYYFPDFEVKDITIETMSDFLNRVRDGNIQV